MNPGLVVKLRPSGPWRIGPDSGARNRVDVIYHSDSLYSAVTAAMSRLGWLEEWLDATARTGSPAVSFSSCFPYLEDIVFVVPPRTVWPPASNSTKAARVRWKSARFVPLTVVQSILSGERLDENQWSVDGPSDCLVPFGKHGPFRTAVRSSASVDRLTGTSERHSTACIEFRAGSGLWTVVSFADEAAQEHWSAKVKAAFRLLADSGFGGERSRGWGRSESPEFIDGVLPDLILPIRAESAAAEEGPAEGTEVSVIAAADIAPLELEPSREVALLPSRDREGAVPEVPSVETPAVAEPDESALLPSRDREGAVPEVPSVETPAAIEPPAPEVGAAPAEAPVVAPDTPVAEAATAIEPPAPEVEAAPAEPPVAAPEVPSVETPAATELATPAVEAAPTEAPAAAPEVPSAETPAAIEPPAPEVGAAPAEAPIAAPDTPVAEAATAIEPPAPEVGAAPAEAPVAAPEVPSVETPAATELATPAVEAAPTEAPAAAPEPPAVEAASAAEPEASAVEATPAEVPPVEPEAPAAVEAAPAPAPKPEALVVEAAPAQVEAPAVEAAPPIAASAPTHPHWLLSLFTPAPADSVDWRRGNYTVLPRGGRVDSPAGSGELKKQISMVAEGSVLYAETAPRGSAADVAPDGFAHPVFRAGFAVAIPLPEVR